MILAALIVGQSLLINFICDTEPSARAVAIDRLWTDAESMPSDCRLLFGLGLPEQAAELLALVDWFALDDGRFIAVGYVLRNGFDYGYSAGEIELLISDGGHNESA